MPKIMIAPFVGRDALPEWLNCLQLTGWGVEVGVHQGDYTRQLLLRWQGKCLFGIDPWEDCDDSDHQREHLPNSTGDRTRDRQMAEEMAKEFEDRIVLKKMTSREAIKQFETDDITKNMLDFVYIDGNHSFSEVLHDIIHWYECLAPGGVLAGHDYCVNASQPDPWSTNIQDAITFAAQVGKIPKTIYVIPETEPEYPWSWFVRKPVV